jgi:hypothetical protein
VNVQCSNCGLRATFQPTGRDRWTLSHPSDFVVSCPVVSAKLEEKEKLTGDEIDCPDLSRSAQLAFNEWKKRTGIR